MLKDFIKKRQERVYSVLSEKLEQGKEKNSPLFQAMKYSTLNGGKRLRSILVYAVGEMLNADHEELDIAAASVEMIHAFSLIHDDLPAMDDDELRRGKPTCHIEFDEATAILAGDALQTLAFETLSAKNTTTFDAEVRILMLHQLARASGAVGMAGGQHIDVQSSGKYLTLTQLQHMHELKTGKLIEASVMLGFLASPHRENQTLSSALSIYAKEIGLAFQIQDDILDVTSNSEALGKATQKDHLAEKATYPGILGLSKSKQQAQIAQQNALESIAKLNFNTNKLQEIANYIVSRSS
jgi:farnesyl diphosphate synthase